MPRHEPGGSIDGLGPSFFHSQRSSRHNQKQLASRSRHDNYQKGLFLFFSSLEFWVYVISCNYFQHSWIPTVDVAFVSQSASHKSFDGGMAPNGHAPAGSRTADRSSQPSSRPMWLKTHGSTEFREWQKEHPTQQLTYDDWKTSRHVEGLSLYYAALQIWDESDSSVSCSYRHFPFCERA